MLEGDSVIWGRADDGGLISAVVPGGADVVSQVRRAWPPLGLTRLHGDPGKSPVVTCPEFLGWERLESDLGLFAAERIAGWVAVHAAVIALDDCAVVLPGPSGSGKSSLCAAALERGLPVLSDEYALVDPVTGMVRGWPRPIRLRDGRGGWVAERPAVSESGGMAPIMVACLAYRLGAQPLVAEEMSPGEVAIAVLDNTVCARSRPLEAFAAALALARAVPGVHGLRGESKGALEALLKIVSLERVTDRS